MDLCDRRRGQSDTGARKEQNCERKIERRKTVRERIFLLTSKAFHGLLLKLVGVFRAIGQHHPAHLDRLSHALVDLPGTEQGPDLIRSVGVVLVEDRHDFALPS
jgi:hypothetical protein